MRVAGPLYEGDGYIHSRFATKLVAGTAARTAKEAESRALEVTGIERLARKLRAHAIAALVGAFFAWIERGAREARRREVERYLAQSTDVVDLEHRMKLLERRGELFC